MKLNEIIFATSNKNKAKEITEILDGDIKIREVDIPEIQSLDLDKVITAKAKAAYGIVKKTVIVEDISFEVESLNGLPGTFIKFFLMSLGTEGTVRLVGKKEKTDTRSIAAVAIYDGEKLKIFKGKVNGTLSRKNRGKHGFGFDRIFIPKGYTITYAEMSSSLKNKISHRAKALKKLKKYLTS